MNVKVENFNCRDVSEILGVDYSTVVGWCRRGIMKSQDISEPGSTRGRYLIEDDEVDRVKALITAYGKRKWMLYNNIPTSTKAVKETNSTTQSVQKLNEDSEEKTDQDSEMELIITAIGRLQHLKKRLAEVDEERTKLIEGIEALRRDINEKL